MSSFMHSHKMRETLKIVSAHIQRTTRGHHLPLSINTNTVQLMHKIDMEESLDINKARLSISGISEMKRTRGRCRSKIIYLEKKKKKEGVGGSMKIYSYDRKRSSFPTWQEWDSPLQLLVTRCLPEECFWYTSCIVKCLHAIWYPGNPTRIISFPEIRIKQYVFDLQMCLMAHSRLLVLCICYNKFPGIICHIYLFSKENILRHN